MRASLLLAVYNTSRQWDCHKSARQWARKREIRAARVCINAHPRACIATSIFIAGNRNVKSARARQEAPSPTNGTPFIDICHFSYAKWDVGIQYLSRAQTFSRRITTPSCIILRFPFFCGNIDLGRDAFLTTFAYFNMRRCVRTHI